MTGYRQEEGERECEITGIACVETRPRHGMVWWDVNLTRFSYGVPNL